MSAKRHFIGTAMASGLELGILSPDDVVAVITMDVLAHHLPVDLKARLVKTSLQADAMTPTLVLDCLGVEGIVENTPVSLLWKVIANAANRALGTQEDSSVTRSAVKDSMSPLSTSPLGASRKPNLSARASRIRAGATSRPLAIDPTLDEDDAAFDVDTRVGSEQAIADVDVIDEASAYEGDDVTAHGRD